MLLVRLYDFFFCGRASDCSGGSRRQTGRDVVPCFSAENLATLLHADLPTWIRTSAFLSQFYQMAAMFPSGV
jgi:hypothetical protein